MYLSSLSLALNRPGAVSLEQVVASLFAADEQGAWYDPSAANVTWRRNLLTYTEQFDNAAWLLDGAGTTRTANQAVAPDSTTTADRIVFTAASRGVYQDVTIGNGAFTGSYYVKAGQVSEEGKTIAIGVGNATDGFTDVLITLTSDWQRITATRTTNAGTTCRCAIHTYAGATARDVLVWGAQLERGTTATAYQRIVTPEITYLADVQSQPLLFQDYGGTVPVVSVESPVGLILDKRNGLALGSELVDTMNTAAAWTPQGNNTVTDSNGEVTVTYVDTLLGAYAFFRATAGLSSNLTIGKWYKLTGEAKVNTGTVNITVVAAETANVADITSTTFVPFSVYFAAGSATGNYLRVGSMGAGEAITLRNLSLKLLDGNHAYQTGSTARPVLRARYNLLTYSEQFTTTWTANACSVSVNTAAAPDGTTTADKVIPTAGSDQFRELRQNIDMVGGAVYCFSQYVKADGYRYVQLIGGSTQLGTFAVNFDIDPSAGTETAYTAGTSTVIAKGISSVGNGWYRIFAAVQCLATGNSRFAVNIIGTSTAARGDSWSANGTSGVLYWGAQIVVGTSAGDYQRIEAAPTAGGGAVTYATTSTITSVAFKPYLFFDGSDDRLLTATVDFSATDNCTLAAGLFLRVAQNGILAEYGDGSGGALNASWTMSATPTDNNGIFFRSRGTASASVDTASPTAPAYAIVVGQADISSDTLTLRSNGVQIDSSASDQGTGNYSSSHYMHFGARPSSAFMANNVYGYVIRMAASTAGEVTSIENYLASKAGVTL